MRLITAAAEIGFIMGLATRVVEATAVFSVGWYQFCAGTGTAAVRKINKASKVFNILIIQPRPCNYY
ncbi:MAG TPA: hypothetical protein DCZ92_12180 [Elusimicrobia bacterium]|nr:MAG: hypothetical protein A2016_00865 [Elusimicrobia bacterium GWF2_62_30]HBA61548.1 hypothetical protein [Elusimicrobiota bacterium]